MSEKQTFSHQNTTLSHQKVTFSHQKTTHLHQNTIFSHQMSSLWIQVQIKSLHNFSLKMFNNWSTYLFPFNMDISYFIIKRIFLLSLFGEWYKLNIYLIVNHIAIFNFLSLHENAKWSNNFNKFNFSKMTFWLIWKSWKLCSTRRINWFWRNSGHKEGFS